MDANATCEDRVAGHLAGRIADLEQFHARINRETEWEGLGIEGTCTECGEVDDVDAGGMCETCRIVELDTDAEQAREELDEWPLSVELRHTMVVQLSTGGPGDQFEIEIERGRHGWELADTAATYRFLDWFDGATRRTNDADVIGWLESLVECLAED